MEVEEIKSIIRFHRKKSGLTQAELAKFAGLGKTVIFDIEKGKSTIKLETFLKILKALNIQLILKSPLLNIYAEEENENS